MPITNQDEWNKCEEINVDAYSKACVDVAREVMKLLDETEDFDTHEIISCADGNVKTGGITGFMAGCVAQMVAHCHSRGEEFRRKWNIDNQIKDEGERANKGQGVLNPAILNID